MRSNEPVVATPVAAATAAQVEFRPFLRDLARATAVYAVGYGTLLGTLLYHYV